MIRGYTDIEQSKVLAEILPSDSADMARCGGENVIMTDYISAKKKFSVCGELTITPCWSLSALLSALPKLGAEEPSIQKLYYASNPTERYICQYSLTNMTGEYDNPVDACYEMVLLLKEKNLIWKQQN